MKLSLPAPYNLYVNQFASFFNKAGYKLYLVGGACRDIILNRGCYDFDFSTDATPESVVQIFKRTRYKVIETGLKHGTVTVRFKGNNFEVTTFRIDGDYQDSRHPDQVNFNASLEEDLSRRDFTINAFAAKIDSTKDVGEQLEVVDLFGGLEDIKKKQLKAIGDPTLRFSEDALRILRLFRFMSQLDFEIDNESLKAASALASNLEKISFERKQIELKKIMLSHNPFKALESMHTSGVLNYLLPELSACYGIMQNHHHSCDVFYHTLYTVQVAVELTRPMLDKADGLDKKDEAKDILINKALNIRLAALCHDLGKPPTMAYKKTINGVKEYSFHNHQSHSAKIAANILGRLKFPNATIAQVTKLVQEHMILGCKNWSLVQIKKFIVRVGKENIEPLYYEILADRRAHLKDGSTPIDDLEYLFATIKKIISDNHPIEIKDLKIDGKKIICLGCPPGKMVGQILNRLLEAVLENKDLNQPEKLKALATYFIKNSIN